MIDKIAGIAIRKQAIKKHLEDIANFVDLTNDADVLERTMSLLTTASASLCASTSQR